MLKCGTGTLALLFAGSRVAFNALTCKSWNCPHCRRVNAAQVLNRMRRGMESRPDWNRMLVTLTINPSRYGARPIGKAGWDQKGNRVALHKAVRRSNIWSRPTAKQFDRAIADMSKEWDRLNDRLGRKAKRAEVERHEYFRTVELHRNVWPHYHAIIEHPIWQAADIQPQVDGWKLGSVVEVKDCDSLDSAVGEVAPYLVNTETKGAGHKAYQFAGRALPKHFRLYSPSRGFLADHEESDQDIEHAIPLTGHFWTHHEAVTHWGADSRIVLPVPSENGHHKPPGSATATGPQAVRYYLEQLAAKTVQLTADQATRARGDSDPPTPADSH